MKETERDLSKSKKSTRLERGQRFILYLIVAQLKIRAIGYHALFLLLR